MKYILILIIILTLYKCTNKNNSKIEDALVIKNEIVLTNLVEYYNKFLSNARFEHILTLDIFLENDTNTFVIYYDMNLFSLINEPPSFFTKVNNFSVAIRSNIGQYFSQKNEYISLQIEENLPMQFKIYRDQNEIPPPITYRNEIWVLKFKGEKLISKEIR